MKVDEVCLRRNGSTAVNLSRFVGTETAQTRSSEQQNSLPKRSKQFTVIFRALEVCTL